MPKWAEDETSAVTLGECWGIGPAAVIKVLLAYENGMLPANLHFHEPNPNSESLKNGTIKV
jgi:hypothetical protein